MFDANEIENAVTAMISDNEDWAEILMYAPGAAAMRIALAFFASQNLGKWSGAAKDRKADEQSRMSAQKKLDEYREFREMLERQLSASELKYLYEAFKRMNVEAARDHYLELLQAKPQEEQAKAEEEYKSIAAEIDGEAAEKPAEPPAEGEQKENPPQEPVQAEGAEEPQKIAETGSEKTEENAEGEKQEG